MREDRRSRRISALQGDIKPGEPGDAFHREGREALDAGTVASGDTGLHRRGWVGHPATRPVNKYGISNLKAEVNRRIAGDRAEVERSIGWCYAGNLAPGVSSCARSWCVACKET